MLSTVAKILVGAAVGLLLLVAVAFAFAGDLLSAPAPARREPLRRLPASAADPNIENVAFLDEARP